MKRFLVCLLITTFFVTPCWAQQEIKKHSSGPRRQLATIVFAGLGGSILGLSTLSFYGRPQDQLSNIAIGFAIGVITGTIYVTFRSATTHDYIDEPIDKTRDGLFPPAQNTAPLETAELEMPKFLWSPLVEKSESQSITSLGGRIFIFF